MANQSHTQKRIDIKCKSSEVAASCSVVTNASGHFQMIAKKLPDFKLLKHLFTVDPDSPSGLRWKNPRSKKLKTGDIAGYKNKKGYWLVGVNCPTSKMYLTHRIVWFLCCLQDPTEKLIDHVDQNKSNNNIKNLRLATHQTNKLNTNKPKRTNNTSKYKGVSFEKRTNKWTAKIQYKGKCYRLGTFETELKAAKAYDKKAKSFNCQFVCLNFPSAQACGS